MTNNGEDSNQDIEDFSDPDVDEVPGNIDDEGPEEVEDVHGPSFSNSSHCIILRNESRGNMLNVYPDAAHASDFPEYADIVHAHRLAINSQFEELFVRQQFENKADCVFPSNNTASNLNAKNGVETSNTVRGRTCSISVTGRGSHHGPTELISKTGDMRVGSCATYNLNAEQYIDDVYTLERTSRIWGNEFPVLRDVSTWEVQPPAFEIFPDRSLRRRIKGRPTTMRIRNGMDIREQVDPKRCTICRTVGHNRSKCPHSNVYTGQSSRSERN
ncbi:hypothetical protein GOBAR_AA00334 [Gossypium barbadense]|uniref:Uncharacterized protein n=1 Tax=Gossypium barbadense TaxID=3634 RepID=A0A2P5YX83_GOSBA|nr:hypothetical protein GOBAR_AA00334 [Gossypium barbadense]